MCSIADFILSLKEKKYYLVVAQPHFYNLTVERVYFTVRHSLIKKALDFDYVCRRIQIDKTAL